MEIEQFIKIAIYIHAIIGGCALLFGAIAIATTKGGENHKKAGKAFYYTMLVSVITSICICLLPNHENSFLFSIGIFSLYFLITGYRCLAFKKEPLNLKKDKLISYTIIVTGIIMIFYPIIFRNVVNFVLSVFGIVAIFFGCRDVYLFRNTEKLKEKWLQLHIIKMVNGYIAAITAFFVVSNILYGMWNWFVPSVFGVLYTTFWMRKLRKNIKTELR